MNFENKKQLIDEKDSWQFNSHMGGLGMWIRNNWGINGGSRLLKYFNDRNIGKEMFGNDEISGVIINQYITWLKGDRDSWKKWKNKILSIKKLGNNEIFVNSLANKNFSVQLIFFSFA